MRSGFMLFALVVSFVAWGNDDVEAKIAALGARDDRIGWDERPENWLAKRIDLVKPS
jgi:hypothetical protein